MVFYLQKKHHTWRRSGSASLTSGPVINGGVCACLTAGVNGGVWGRSSLLTRPVLSRATLAGAVASFRMGEKLVFSLKTVGVELLFPSVVGGALGVN